MSGSRCFVFSFHTHFAIIHRHIIHANFYVIWLVYVPRNKWSLICSTFLGTINLLHFTPLFVFTSSRYHTFVLVNLTSHFSSMERMLMLIVCATSHWRIQKFEKVGPASVEHDNGCLGALLPVGSRGKALGKGVWERSIPEAERIFYNKWLSFEMKIQHISSFPTNSW